MRDLLLLLLVLRRRQRRQNRRQRRVWVHETLQTRAHSGEFHTLVRELHSFDDRFFQYFRMSQAQFAHILSIPRSCPTRAASSWRSCIPCGRAHTTSRGPGQLGLNSPTSCFWWPRYASLPASAVTGCGMTTAKQKRWLVKRTAGRRNTAGISLWKRSSAIPLGCHAEINKSALIGQVRNTARYTAGITPSVNGPLGHSN